MTDWWQADPVVSPAPVPSAGGDWWQADPVVKGSNGGDMSWSDVAGEAVANALPSAIGQAKQIGHAFAHPIETAGALGNLANAVEDKAMGAIGVHRAPGFELPADVEAMPSQIAKSYVDRYGGIDKLKKSIAEDPIGVLSDFSTALMGTGGIASRLPGIAGKVGSLALKAGDLTNPAGLTVRPAAAASDEAARLGSKINAPTTEDLYDAAEAAYEKPAVKELAVKPSAFRTWKDTLLANNDVIDEDLSPKTFNILKRLDNPPSGSFIDGRSIQSLRRKLGQAAGSSDATERLAARQAKESLDTFLGNVPKTDVLRGDPAKVSAALKEARGNYATAKRSDLIEGKLEAANLQAGSANSGMNLDNATRQRMKDILKSDKLRRGFSNEELAQIRKISVGTPMQNLTRRVANMLGGGGGIGSTVTSAIGAEAGDAIGHTAGGILGAALPAAVGYGLKRLSAAMTQADVRRLQEIVRSRSPLGQKTQSSLGKFGTAATILRGAPSAKNVARFMLASRNLSTNLADVGINVTPENIAGTGVTQ